MSSKRYNILMFLLLLHDLNAFSSHWNRVLPRICSETTPERVRNALISCDQHMDREAKAVFDDCVYEVIGTEVSADKPRICYYQGRGQQLDSCKNNRYKEKNYGIKQIISKELKHMWCLMKIARPLGWEHLCAPNLPNAKKLAIRRCDETFREITNPINQCYGQFSGHQNDGRPIACRSFENTLQLWECLERRAKQRKRPKTELESKANRYMDCLKNV